MLMSIPSSPFTPRTASLQVDSTLTRSPPNATLAFSEVRLAKPWTADSVNRPYHNFGGFGYLEGVVLIP